MPADRPQRRETFPWTETATRVRALSERYRFEAAAKDRGFDLYDGDRRVALLVPPLVQRIRPATRDPAAYEAALSPGIGTQAVILLQAGAASLGLWRDDDLLDHKTIKKYVVRGKGRAQPTHLKTRGKSRYGSRLRLRNAQMLLEETNERLGRWWKQHASVDAVFYSCPVRLWADLFRVEPRPPFAQRGVALKIPLDVHVPAFEELKRVRRWLARGHVTWFSASA